MNTQLIPRKGSFKEFISLFFPIALIGFSNYIFLLVEKLLLSRLSAHAMEAAVSTTYIIQTFQIPCIAITIMAQVCVGRWFGSNEWKLVGSGVWQFIWFSFLSMLVTIPCGIAYGQFYFNGSDVEDIVFPYFYFSLFMVFLFPLGTALSSFFLGLGKTRLLLFITVGSQALKLILAYLFIFGWNDWIPSFGLLGGAMSTLIAQGGFCFILFGVFLNNKHAELFHSYHCRFRPRLFWECTQPGLLRAGGRFLNMTCWSAITYLMTSKGGDYLLALSIGGTLFIFLPFLSEAILQTQTTIVSQILGSKNFRYLHKASYSGFLFTIICLFLLFIPFVIFPLLTFHFLFPLIALNDDSIQKVLLGVWVSFVFFALTSVPIAYVVSFKDTKFSLTMGAFNWINGYLLMYSAIEIFKIEANQFWLVLSVMHLTIAICFMLRMKWLISKVSLSSEPHKIPTPS